MSLRIVSVGSAVPDTVISNEFLLSLEWSSEQRSSLEEALTTYSWSERRSCLNQQYIKDARNLELFDSVDALELTPDKLGARAVEQALQRAGISQEQVGLVIGSSLTPIQTCPSEAQRVTQPWESKPNSYDLIFNGCYLQRVSQLLSSWKSESCPEYIVYVVTSAATTRASYTNGFDAAFWSDGAVAFVLSKQHGLLSYKNVEFICEQEQEFLKVPVCGRLSFDLAKYSSLYKQLEKRLPCDKNSYLDTFSSRTSGYVAGINELLMLSDSFGSFDSLEQGAVIKVGSVGLDSTLGISQFAKEA